MSYYLFEGVPMIKILMIAAYDELAKLYSEVFDEQYNIEMQYAKDCEEYSYDIRIACTMEEIFPICEELDPDVIIGRGAPVLDLRKSLRTPIVDIVVAGNDITKALYEAKDSYPNQQIALIGSPNMIFGAESAMELLELDVKLYKVNVTSLEEIHGKVEKAFNDGCKVVVGGVLGTDYASSFGMNTVVIKSGKETIWRAVSEAKLIAKVTKQEKEIAMSYKTMLDYAFEGIISLDNEDNILSLNNAAHKILNYDASNIVGKEKITNVIDDYNFINICKGNKEYLDEIIKYKNIHLAINKIPVMFRGSKVGKVITFQNSSRIQEVENKIRGKLYTKGHTAKYYFSNIIGNSSTITDAKRTARIYSEVEANVVIYGESGTGKELFAQSIHNNSSRANGPFVAINCAAIPGNLLESELFGYVDGAFTGATKGGKMGIFMQAHNGTIFFDEIGDMPINLQSKILRVIQEKEVMQLGDNKVIPIDVRIICATNKNLRESIKNNDFREDLYYRLAVLKVNVPPLRERGYDIVLLCEYYIDNYCNKYNKRKILLTDDAKQCLLNYSWRGNIRELRNICERIVALSFEESVSGEFLLKVLDIDEKETGHNEEIHNYINTLSKEDERLKQIDNLKEYERLKIINTLKKYNNNKTAAAKDLNISRVTLWRKIKEYNIL